MMIPASRNFKISVPKGSACTIEEGGIDSELCFDNITFMTDRLICKKINSFRRRCTTCGLNIVDNSLRYFC